MADRTLSTRLDVPFGAADDVLGGTFLIEQSARIAEGGEAYFRVHPNTTGVTMTSTSGSIFRSATGLHKRVNTYQSFSGQREIQLAYPGAQNVRIELVGQFLNREGVAVNPGLSYDEVRQTLRSSVSGYGTVHITCQAPYELWRARFARASSGTATIGDPQTVIILPGSGSSALTSGSGGVADNDDDPDISGFRPLTVVGFKDDEVQTATLTPTPELTDQSRYSSYADTGARLPRLQAEVDPDFQPRLTTSSGGGLPITAQARIRVYPNVGASLIATSGTLNLLGQNAAITVSESIAFSGQPSAQLRYQPLGSVGVYLTTPQFIDKWGRRFTPDIVLPGDTFQSVRWVNERTYTNVIQRTTNEDEIVVADPFGNAIPAFGVVRVSYAVSYRTYQYTFEYNSDTERFDDAYIVATYEDQSATLQLAAPTTRGYV